MPVLALQRSYKYIMYATKQPSLRIKQADLKCKNGCGYYGNPDWKGYCSKCYRHHMEVDALKNRDGHQKSSVSGFSKFEEKKRQQTDKKNKYLKTIHVFKKPSNAKDIGRLDRGNWRYANPETDKLDAEFISLFGQWGEYVRKDFLKCAHTFITKIYNEIENNKDMEQLAAMVQRYYSLYQSRIATIDVYQHVSEEVREQLMDFFEKYVMVTSYSWLFCPPAYNDEEKDLAIQERIRSLSWVNAHHLDCCINETSVEVRDLVYTAITHLLSVDSVKAPQEKLSYIVKCCRSVVEVLQHCQGGPVSADEFLPALIFVVLKANPARLKSNMLFITRFCNDSRLMQGETGYYFTNLCCAVSFIENLKAKSLNMANEEFDAYMSGKITCVSAWESALVACEGMHQLCEHLSVLKGLSEKTTTVQNGTMELRSKMEQFKEEITERVHEVLERTPLIIKPRKTLPLDRQNSIPQGLPSPIAPTVMTNTAATDSSASEDRENSKSFYMQNIQISQEIVPTDKGKLQLDITPCVKVETEPNLEPDTPNFDAQSIDFTPDDHSLQSLSKINYDIDFSDLSGENSIEEDISERKIPSYTPDPFSPVGTTCPITQSPLVPNPAPFPSTSLKRDDFVLPFLEEKSTAVEETLIDKKGTTPPECLPSPLKPITSEYTGFSTQGWKIPSIPCNTGDFKSAEVAQSSSTSDSKPDL